jgi:DNA-binding transcriptional ArsR family regulator
MLTFTGTRTNRSNEVTDGISDPAVQALDKMFHALADSSRRSMVDRLCQGPATVTELATPLAMGMPAVLKHLSVLEAGGIVESAKSGRVRTYRMTANALRLAEGWVAERKAWLGQARF